MLYASSRGTALPSVVELHGFGKWVKVSSLREIPGSLEVAGDSSITHQHIFSPRFQLLLFQRHETCFHLPLRPPLRHCIVPRDLESGLQAGQERGRQRRHFWHMNFIKPGWTFRKEY